MYTTYTNTQIFNKVKKHLLTQGAKARVLVNTNTNTYWSCMLRAPEGLTCAIGCLIPHECYKYEMEQETATSLSEKFTDKKLGFNLSNHVDLLDELQSIHDSWDVEEWPYELEKLSKEHGVESL